MSLQGRCCNGPGIITGLWLKDPTDKQWNDDAEMKIWREFMGKYMPGANQEDGNYIYAYSVSFLMEQTLKKCGDDHRRAAFFMPGASIPLHAPLPRQGERNMRGE